ncbi:MAG: RNA polymerase sigma factor [Oscillospiraceae bacterium]|nr:RNA polymerase sigma factor [Oscillospiraceae bacterium]
MKELSVRPADKDLENLVLIYSNMLFKLCFTILCNNADAEDAVSDVMVRYITSSPDFSDDEHKKAWLIRVATNICKDMLRKRRNHLNIDDICEYCQTEERTNIVSEILNLPVKYKTVIYLYYIEGYKTKEIADILSVTPSAVRKRLQYGRNMLRIEYGKDGSE